MIARLSRKSCALLAAGAIALAFVLARGSGIFATHAEFHQTTAAEVSAASPRTGYVELNESDTFDDGTPDFLRLASDHDELAFRRWFTALAEGLFFQPERLRPAEVTDCAALIRYSYRETLRLHDGAWAAASGAAMLPALDSIDQYRYPFTPLGPLLFRVRSGAFRSSDLHDGAFAEFANAENLWRHNTFLVGRRLSKALPGDLLFFRRDGERPSFHSMIFLGASRFDHDGRDYLVYHTGREGSDPGEIRRPSVDELLHHPQAEWRPLLENPNFLGVYRWNILRKAF